MNANFTLGSLFFLPAWLLPVTPALSRQPRRTLGDSRATFPLDAVGLSPNGKFLLAADFAGTYRLGFSPNGRLRFSLATHLWSIDNKQTFVWDLTGEKRSRPLGENPKR